MLFNPNDPPRMTFGFAHISDLHLPPMPAVGLPQIANKRLLGYLSWHRKRKHSHRPEAITALERDLAGRELDHICVTGDITNLGLPLEFQAADRWLAARAPSDAITFVPGNHDAYVAASLRAMHECFSRWLPDAYPFTHRHAGVLFIGLSTAVATAPFLATGRIGAGQLGRLASLLKKTAKESVYRILLLHHPPGRGIVKPRKALRDAAELNRLLADNPVDLVLHGHGHRAAHYTLPAAGGAIPVFGAGAASLIHRERARTGHYHVFELTDRELWVIHRRYSAEQGFFETSGETTLPRQRC